MPPFELPPGYESQIKFDNGNALGYNGERNEEYAAVAGLDQHEQVVNMDTQKPIHDNKCRHKTLIPNPEDTTRRRSLSRLCECQVWRWLLHKIKTLISAFIATMETIYARYR
jgi:hypothetical protein